MSHFTWREPAKNVWDAMRKSYLNVRNSLQVYELMKQSFHLYHGNRSLFKYYNEELYFHRVRLLQT